MGNCTQYIIYLNALNDALASIKKTWHHWACHGSSPPPPPILGGDLKISDQINWGGPEQKIKF